MSFPEGLAFQESLMLIATVQAHWMRLQAEEPTEAAFFRQKLLELFNDQMDTPASKERSDQEPRKTQLYTLQCWEKERSHLEEQLRTGVGQLLANAAVELAACVTLLDSDVELVRRGLQALEQELRDGLKQFRSILASLEFPYSMKELGLLSSLLLYAQRIAKQNQVVIQTHFPAQMPRFSPAVEIGVYRVIQEALHNAIEHSGTTVINLIVEQQKPNGPWQFIVRDEGTGFEPANLSQVRGLTHMYEWAQAFGGDLDIQSKPGHGTTVRLTIHASELAID